MWLHLMSGSSGARVPLGPFLEFGGATTVTVAATVAGNGHCNSLTIPLHLYLHLERSPAQYSGRRSQQRRATTDLMRPSLPVLVPLLHARGHGPGPGPGSGPEPVSKWDEHSPHSPLGPEGRTSKHVRMPVKSDSWQAVYMNPCQLTDWRSLATATATRPDRNFDATTKGSPSGIASRDSMEQPDIFTARLERAHNPRRASCRVVSRWCRPLGSRQCACFEPVTASLPQYMINSYL